MKKRNIKTLAGFLRAVKETIENGWTQGQLVADKHSRPLNAVSDPRAARFCLLGGCRRVGFENIDHTLANRAESLIAQCVPANYGHSVITFNDSRATKKKDVLALLDTAIERAKTA